MQLYTLGFAGKSAETFFTTLLNAEVKTLVDIRLNNRSQLAGFTKSGDLEFFLNKLCSIAYTHLPLLAPSQELLAAYRAKEVDWAGYTKRFEALMTERKADAYLRQELKILTKPICLLCSEPLANQCHRSIIAEHIVRIFPKTEVIHL